MPEARTLRDTEYTLTERAILGQSWLGTATLPDVLARPAVITEAPEPVLREVIVRRSGPEFTVVLRGGAGVAPSCRQAIEGVVDLLSLQPGWNSYSAKPISLQNVKESIRILAAFMNAETPPPAIVPSVRGGIQIEWHTRGVNLEIYIESPDRVSFFAEHVESEVICEEPLFTHERELQSWIERISRR